MSRADRSPHLPATHEDDALAFLRGRIGGLAQWTGLFSNRELQRPACSSTHTRTGSTASRSCSRKGENRSSSSASSSSRSPRYPGPPSRPARALEARRRPRARRLREPRRPPLRGATRLHFELTLALISTNFLLARAAIIPSTGARTVLVGVLVTTLLVASTFVAYRTAARDVAWSSAFVAAQWGAIAVTSSSILSRRLYALLRRADAAERFGQYTLEEKIGEGGMGEVFRARHALLKRATALKLLPRARAGAQAIARFEREVQVTSRLTHPNTIQIYDFGYAEDGTFYYAMELIDGMTLDGLVKECGAQPPRGASRKSSPMSARRWRRRMAQGSSTATSSRRTKRYTRVAVCMTSSRSSTSAS